MTCRSFHELSLLHWLRPEQLSTCFHLSGLSICNANNTEFCWVTKIGNLRANRDLNGSTAFALVFIWLSTEISPAQVKLQVQCPPPKRSEVPLQLSPSWVLQLLSQFRSQVLMQQLFPLMQCQIFLGNAGVRSRYRKMGSFQGPQMHAAQNPSSCRSACPCASPSCQAEWMSFHSEGSRRSPFFGAEPQLCYLGSRDPELSAR